MTSVRLPGMVVESEGEGPPVIMLHGLGGTSNSFQPLLAPLAGFRIVRPDLPGAGRSPPPPQQITVALLVQAVADAAAHLGVNRAHVVGHSFGTLIAQHIAAGIPSAWRASRCSDRSSSRRMRRANGCASAPRSHDTRA